MLGSTSRLAERLARAAITVALASAVGTEACGAIVSDTLPNLPCQPGGGEPSDTCPSGQTCSDAGVCVSEWICAAGACSVDAAGPADAAGENAADILGEGSDDAGDDGAGDDGSNGTGDGVGDDGGDDGAGDGALCAIPGSLGCPCTDSVQCSPKSPHCMLDAIEAGTDDGGDAALVAYCSHGCKVDADCVPLQCSPITRACAP